MIKKKLGKRKWPRSQAIGSQKQGKGTENIYKLGGEINSTWPSQEETQRFLDNFHSALASLPDRNPFFQKGTRDFTLLSAIISQGMNEAITQKRPTVITSSFSPSNIHWASSECLASGDIKVTSLNCEKLYIVSRQFWERMLASRTI